LGLSLAYERVGQATDAYRAYRQVLTPEPAQVDVTRVVRDGRPAALDAWACWSRA